MLKHFVELKGTEELGDNYLWVCTIPFTLHVVICSIVYSSFNVMDKKTHNRA